VIDVVAPDTGGFQAILDGQMRRAPLVLYPRQALFSNSGDQLPVLKEGGG
jgi:hypothetical protein